MSLYEFVFKPRSYFQTFGFNFSYLPATEVWGVRIRHPQFLITSLPLILLKALLDAVSAPKRSFDSMTEPLMTVAIVTQTAR